VTVTALAPAPAARTWTLYTEPDHVCGWNAASDDWHTPRATCDLRVGGGFVHRMEARDGSFGFDFAGTWTRVDAPRALAYTMEDGRTAEVSFEETDGGTRVTVTFDIEDQNAAEMQRTGWQAILDNFAKYVGQHK
jgi:uncharacterized protein YndB with AHSA1/START domain